METQVLSKANVACPWRANLGLAPGQFGSEVAVWSALSPTGDSESLDVSSRKLSKALRQEIV